MEYEPFHELRRPFHFARKTVPLSCSRALKGVGRRIWWKNLILLRATDPKADLLQTIDPVHEDKLQSEGQTL